MVSSFRADQWRLATIGAVAATMLLTAIVCADEPPTITRPVVLTPLEVGFAGLQILDVHSTLRANGHGTIEVNPVVSALGSSPAGLIATKTAVTIGVVYVSEKLWHHHKIAAILLLVGLNSGYAVAVAHNYKLQGGSRGRSLP